VKSWGGCNFVWDKGITFLLSSHVLFRYYSLTKFLGRTPCTACDWKDRVWMDGLGREDIVGIAPGMDCR